MNMPAFHYFGAMGMAFVCGMNFGLWQESIPAGGWMFVLVLAFNFIMHATRGQG